MNLVERYREKTIKIVTTGRNGAVTESEIQIGNAKGILVVRVGDERHQPTDRELEEVHEALANALRPGNEIASIIVPYYISVEYIRM